MKLRARETEFIIQHERGYGDYTQMRKGVFDKKSLNEILEEMNQMGGKGGIQGDAREFIVSCKNLHRNSSPLKGEVR